MGIQRRTQTPSRTASQRKSPRFTAKAPDSEVTLKTEQHKGTSRMETDSWVQRTDRWLPEGRGPGSR